MDKEEFELVDGILATVEDVDGRATATALLELGVTKDDLQEYAQVIANRYCLCVESVIDWYAEVLTRRLDKLRELRKADG